MKIKSIHIENFRSFRDETVVLNNYTCLVGPNGSGKSTVLCALNVFFREGQNSATDLARLQEEDFHNRDTSQPIQITVTFNDLSTEAQRDFAHYFRHGELVVAAIANFDEKTRQAEVRQYGYRNCIKSFAVFFEADDAGKPAGELTRIYTELRAAYPELPGAARTKAAVTDALREYESGHPELCELIKSPDQFYGFTKGDNRLSKYVQWIFIPAVKDATTEELETKETALGKILARTVRSMCDFGRQVGEIRLRAEREYRILLNENQQALDDVSAALHHRLIDWAHPDASLRIEWRHDPTKTIRIDEPFAEIIAGEDGFEGKLSRFGHGLQRCYLLALLHELSGCDATDSPRLLLGCEEPELFQHPPQAQHLATVFQTLSQHNSQVIVCTHSPHFVSGQWFEDVRMVCKDRTVAATTVSQPDTRALAEKMAAATGRPVNRPEGVVAKIHQALQPALNELFFAPVVVLVEGLEDVAYITTHLHLIDRWDEWRRYGCHLVPANGKSRLILPLAIAQDMCIPTFVVFDSDAHRPDRNGSRLAHENDNRAILTLCEVERPDPMPTETYWGDQVVMWDSEMGKVVQTDLQEAMSHEKWTDILETARQQNGQVENLEKNALFIADLLALAWARGIRSSTLDRLCATILRFAERRDSPSSAAAAAIEVSVSPML